MTNNDRLFLITSATGKTGKPTARLLLNRGHRVRAFVHREDDRSRQLAAEGAEIVVGDLLDFHDVSSALRGVSGAYFCYPIAGGLLDATVAFAQAASEAGIRSVVNMSQFSARREAGSNAARQHWLAERLLDRTAMLTAHLRPTFFAEWISAWWGRQGDEGVLGRGAGSIINIASMAGQIRLAGGAAYGATKAALASLTRSWAAEFSPSGIRVNAVAAGPVLTAGAASDRIEALGATTLLSRAAQPAEIAEAITFLASPKASYITGAVFSIDGGRTAI